MVLQEFINQYRGKYVDFDNAYGAQCVDLVQFYNRDVVGGARLTGNAKDIFGQQPDKYEWVKNTPDGVPPPGAIVVYGGSVGGGYGDVTVSQGGNASTFTGFGQNYPYGAPTHSAARNYAGMTGWGIPKTTPPPVPQGGTAEAIRLANVRIAPTTGAALGGSQQLQPGQTFKWVAKVTGESVSQWGITTNIWYHSQVGNYVWAGNCRDI